MQEKKGPQEIKLQEIVCLLFTFKNLFTNFQEVSVAHVTDVVRC